MVLNNKSYWPRTSYNSEIHNITTEFFNPAFYNSTSYRRITGLFNSNSLTLAARGISEFVNNDGKIQLIISPILTREDSIAITKASTKEFEEILKRSLVNNLSFDNQFEKDHIFALMYLLNKRILEIKVDIPTDQFGNPLDYEKILEYNLFSEKLGVFQDREGNVVSFRGPIDSDSDSWENGKFSITVDASWIPGQKQHVLDDIEKFEKKWNDKNSLDIPIAIKNELINIFHADSMPDLKKYDAPKWAILPNGQILWDNQIKAINSWNKNNFKGIFPVATGGGKTLASLVAGNRLPFDVVILVIVPFKELARQWILNIKNFDPNADTIACYSENPEWKINLPKKLNRYMSKNDLNDIKKRLYVIGVSKSISAKKNSDTDDSLFIEYFRHLNPEKLLIIGDEVHHYGAETSQKIFELKAKYTLGLSATHIRPWDDEGTKALTDFFGRSLNEAKYTVSEGIEEGRLSQYYYYPFFTTLTNKEFENYENLTESINKIFHISKDNKTTNQIQNLTTLTTRRADILKNAENKIKIYCEIIKTKPKLPYIIFADDNEQIEKLIIAHKQSINEINQNSTIILSDNYFIFSGDTGESDRKIILEQSVTHDRPIFSMKCLDEGIDVPDFSGAILVASSRSKREYIQRRGRILRKSSTTKIKELYDIIIFPPPHLNPSQVKIAQNILDTEYERFSELRNDAINQIQALEKYRHYKNKLQT